MNPVPLLHDLLHEAAARRPDSVALVVNEARLRYADIEARSNALAHFLVQRGVERGDRVVLFSDNTVEAVVSVWAVLKANAVFVVVNPTMKADKLAYVLNDCRPRVVISEGRLAHVFRAAVARAPSVTTVIATGEAPEGAVRFEGAILDGITTRPPPRRCIDVDLAAIIYTSGSTGTPKGVMLTHLNMRTAARSLTSILGTRSEDVTLSVLPLSFNYGLYQVLLAAAVGSRLVLERSFAFPVDVMRRIPEEGVTGLPIVPTISATLTELKNLDPERLTSVRFITNTAAALPLRHIAALKRIFSRAKLYSMYGLTECKRCTYLPPADLDRKPTSVGIAIPDTEVWLVDERGERLTTPNQVGELVVRGATVMRGYWEKPEETARRLRPGPLPGELVLYTGDYCRLDEDGYVYFVSRMDDVIKSRGEKVAPREVEAALCEIPGIKEAAVIGVEDALLGQAVKAFVVLEAEAHLTPRDIQVACQERLESYMVPKHVELLAALPKTATGKITKAGLA